MKILIIGGMHGNEPLGPSLIADLKKNPIAGVDTIIGNPRAIKINERFTEQDLNRSFPGNVKSAIYEERRAAKIVEACKGYDLVLDFHNTIPTDNDCSFIGDGANPLLLQVASYLDLKRVIVADYNCINKYVPSCISIEISINSLRMDRVQWHTALQKLAALKTLPAPQGLNFYRYVLTVTNDQCKKLQLDKQDLRVFQEIPLNVATQLNVAPPAYPIFLGKSYSKGVYTGILQKINNL